MIISLDYDETFTADKALWIAFIQLAQICGHKVYIVTMRSEEHDWHSDFEFLWEAFGVHTVFCDGESKRDVTEREDIKIDIWIDDRPEGIAHGSTFAMDKLEEWRTEQKASGGIETKV